MANIMAKSDRRNGQENGQEGNKLQTGSMTLKCENKISDNGVKNLLALWQVYQITRSNNFSVSRVSYHRNFVALM